MDKTGETESRFHRSAEPKEISQQCTPATHTEEVHCKGILGGLPSLSLTSKSSWVHLGEGRQPTLQPSDASILSADI